MIEQKKVAGEPSEGFDPLHKQEAEEAPAWLGLRKSRSNDLAVRSVYLEWPEERRAQFKLFDSWHDIAMQAVHLAGGSFRTMAVYRAVIHWKVGMIWSSDAELALLAGRCSEKAISREIAFHRSIGIIAVERGWRVYAGKRLRTRTIRLAVPEPMDPRIIIRDLPSHTDTRGPDEDAVHTDTRGPKHTDTRGLITIDTNEEGASRNVSA